MTDRAKEIREQLLILRCQAGDEAAFAEIVARYQRRLRYYVRRLLDDSSTADDVMQSLWLAVYRGIGRLHSPAAFTTWLYTIARRTALRERHRPERSSEAITNGELISDETEPSFAAEDTARIHAGLQKLSAEHREVVVLRFLEDLSYEEIARITGAELGTVRSRLHYAKRLLKEILEQEKHDE